MTDETATPDDRAKDRTLAEDGARDEAFAPAPHGEHVAIDEPDAGPGGSAESSLASSDLTDSRLAGERAVLGESPADSMLAEAAPEPVVAVPTAEPPVLVEPEPDPPALVEPDRTPPARPESASATGSVRSDIGQPTTSEPIAEPATAEPANGLAATAATAGDRSTSEPAVQTIYVHAPVPPKPKHNRLFGLVIALAAAVVFAAGYAAVAFFVMPLFAPTGAVSFNFVRFIVDVAFLVPVGIFAVSFILLALLANRANWWAYIIGSLIVAAVVYFATIGILLLINGVVSLTPAEAADEFRAAAGKPLVFVAAIVAREVVLWFGAIIATRGRRLRVRNAQARDEFEREAAQRKAEFEQAATAG